MHGICLYILALLREVSQNKSNKHLLFLHNANDELCPAPVVTPLTQPCDKKGGTLQNIFETKQISLSTTTVCNYLPLEK